MVAKSAAMFSVDEVRQRYGVTEGTVLGWIHSGELKAINVGRKPGSKRPRWRVPQSAIETFELIRTASSTPAPSRKIRRPAGDVIQFYGNAKGGAR